MFPWQLTALDICTHLYQLGEFPEGSKVGRLGPLNNGGHSNHSRLVQLPGEPGEVLTPRPPELYLLQWARTVGCLQRLLARQHLLDLTCPVDHYH